LPTTNNLQRKQWFYLEQKTETKEVEYAVSTSFFITDSFGHSFFLNIGLVHSVDSTTAGVVLFCLADQLMSRIELIDMSISTITS